MYFTTFYYNVVEQLHCLYMAAAHSVHIDDLNYIKLEHLQHLYCNIKTHILQQFLRTTRTLELPNIKQYT